jgi:transposase-like protein
MADLAATNFCAVGRKYGVSDNAVRKWVRWYETERERTTVSGTGCEGVDSGIGAGPGPTGETK